MRKEQLKNFNLSKEVKEDFERYLQDFDFIVEDLKDRAILDVGSGMIPGFVEYLLQNKITDKVYAVDQWPFGHELESFTTDEDLENIEFYPLEKAQQMQSKKYFVQAEGQKLPFRKDAKFDFIFMRASLNDSEGISERIEEAVAYLQNGGELRIAPVWQRGPNIKELRKAADKLNKDSFSVEWKKGIVKRENVKEKALLLIIKKKHQS